VGDGVTPTIRPYTEADFAACLELSNARDPAHAVSLSDAWNNYLNWDTTRYHRLRYVVQDEAGQVIGWGEIAHNPWTFNPDQYDLRLEVEPGWTRQGADDMLLEQLLAELRTRHARLARAAATDDDVETIHFLTRHGFREAWRELESRLELAAFDPAPFAAAGERVAAQNVTVAPLTDETVRDSSVLRELYELYEAGNASQEKWISITMTPFAEFVAGVIHGPQAIIESWFLARMEHRLVGLSTLERVPGQPDVVEAGFTTVHPDYRGRGIALALKLRTIAFAREHGYRYIKTGSNAANTRMLGINAALGFALLPARITFERPLAEETAFPDLRKTASSPAESPDQPSGEAGHSPNP
jgi:mycothiol synthase